MSAAIEVQRAIVAALSGHAPLMAVVTAIYDGPPADAVLPYVEIDGGATADWSTKTESGREHRVALVVRDDGTRPARLHGLMAEVELAVAAMARELPGHRVASVAFLRARVVRGRPGEAWAGIVEFRVRTLAIG